MARVRFEHVEKVFPDGTRAIVDCNLAVEDGELVVLVGPSGCGKSTLLRLIAGLEEVTRGTLTIGDRVANDLAPRERNVAMVFQDYALYPHMTVRGNLEFPLRMGGLVRAEIERRVAWASEILDLGKVLERRPRQLSGGQQQRVAMGRALVREPSVFLLDEPLSNLDAKLRVEVRAQIADLQRRLATTMLYVTHDQTEAMTLGDRVAVMDAGRILQIAPPREIYERPAGAFVAGFIGSPPMNLFRVNIGGEGTQGATIEFAGQSLPLSEGLAARARAVAGSAEGADVLTAGIRPEAFRLAPAGADGASVRARVEHVEWLGHETLVYARIVGGGAERAEPGDRGEVKPIRLVARLPGMELLERGQEIALGTDPDAIHLFGSGGRNLSATPPPG